jgi:glycosyltransferase involved in cell wall biosynthesis
MHILLQPSSQQAFIEAKHYQSELFKVGAGSLPIIPEEHIDPSRDRVLTWDSRERERLKERFKVDLVLPGVDTRLRCLRTEPRPYDVLRVATPLDVSMENGFDEAVRMFLSLGRHQPWHWYVVGEPADAKYFDKLTDTLEYLGLEGCISFLGPMSIEGRIRLFMNMDIGLYPARESPLCPTLLEMIQLGLPLVSSPVGFAEEILKGDDQTLIVRDWQEVAPFLLRYRGLERTVRKARTHALLSRRWAQVASELKSVSADTLLD